MVAPCKPVSKGGNKLEYPYNEILISNKNEQTAIYTVAHSLHESHGHNVGEEARYNSTDMKLWKGS